MTKVKEVRLDSRRKAPWPKPGYRYGYLVVTSRGMDDRTGHQRFWCRCDCGRIKLIRADYLQNGRISSCGHLLKGVRLDGDRVIAYRCVETGELFESVRDALKFAGAEDVDGRKFCANARTRHEAIGVHPETGEPLHWVAEYVPGELKRARIQDNRYRKNGKKKIILLNTGIVYKSLAEAARISGVAWTEISECCRGLARSAGKDEFGDPLVWMYYDEWLQEAKKAIK